MPEQPHAMEQHRAGHSVQAYEHQRTSFDLSETLWLTCKQGEFDKVYKRDRL